MNIDRELLKIYVDKNIITDKTAKEVLEESASLGISVRECIRRKEYASEEDELCVLGEYYAMPYIEIDMLDIDRSLFELFTLEFMRRYRVVPVSMSIEGKLLVATSAPLDCSALSAIGSQIVSEVDQLLVPPSQLERYIDSIAASVSTYAALNDLSAQGEDTPDGLK